MNKLAFIIGSLVWSFTLYGAPNPKEYKLVIPKNGKEFKGIELAQKSKKSRRKILQGEARGSSKQTSIDFDAAAIDGERRAPVGISVGGSKRDDSYDLINLRLRWHPEMIKSTSNLETGKGR